MEGAAVEGAGAAFLALGATGATGATVTATVTADATSSDFFVTFFVTLVAGVELIILDAVEVFMAGIRT